LGHMLRMGHLHKHGRIHAHILLSYAVAFHVVIS
jgi:hypothetical protein